MHIIVHSLIAHSSSVVESYKILNSIHLTRVQNKYTIIFSLYSLQRITISHNLIPTMTKLCRVEHNGCYGVLIPPWCQFLIKSVK